MKDTELNKALALKIGYLPEHIDDYFGQVRVNRPHRAGEQWWYVFDFMAWNTIMPIAVKYGMDMSHFAKSTAAMARLPFKHYVIAPTLQRAIALAVLGVKE